MPNTPNYNLYYPSSTDRPAAYPAAQKTSQETLDTLLKQISDSIPAGDTATLNAAKSHADTGDAATLAAAKSHADGRTPPITVDTSVGTRVMVGGVMVYGMTGWRDIVSLVSAGRTVGGVQMRRVNWEVQVRVDGLVSGTSGFLSTVPNGFRRDHRTHLVPIANDLGDRFGTVAVFLGSMSITSTSSTLPNYWAYFSYPTADLWPTTLPGTPA